MDIKEAIQYVHEHGGVKNQLKYDMMRLKIYGAVGILTGVVSPKTVLDAGCAYGTTSFILSRAGMKVTAIDCMPELHSTRLFAEEGIEFHKVNLETDKIEGKYDLVVLTDVLEHFNYNPLPVLKKLRKAGKSIILSTPSRETDPYMPDTARWKDEINWRQIPEKPPKYEFIDSHHHTYTLWELRDLLHEAGFKIVKRQHVVLPDTWIIVAV